MKYTLIPTDVLKTAGLKAWRGLPYSIEIIEKDGYVYSKWQVRCHYPSPTGDSSDWCSFDIPCLNKQQAMLVGKEYQSAFNIPDDRFHIPEN